MDRGSTPLASTLLQINYLRYRIQFSKTLGKTVCAEIRANSAKFTMIPSRLWHCFTRARAREGRFGKLLRYSDYRVLKYVTSTPLVSRASCIACSSENGPLSNFWKMSSPRSMVIFQPVSVEMLRAWKLGF